MAETSQILTAEVKPAKINTFLAVDEASGKGEIIPVSVNGRRVAHIGHGQTVIVRPEYFEAVVQAATDAGVFCSITTDPKGRTGAAAAVLNSEETKNRIAELEKALAEKEEALKKASVVATTLPPKKEESGK